MNLNRALGATSDPKVKGVIHYNLALVDLARGNRSAALANLELAAGQGDLAARELQARLTQDPGRDPTDVR